MNKLIFANLIHRPLRSVISVLAVAIEVVMILSIVAIFMGMLNDQKQRTNGIGADLVVSPSNASFMNGMSGAAMSAKLAPFLATLPHVAVAAPVIQNFSMGDSLEILYGVDYKTFNALKPFTFIAGGPFQGPNDVIVDDVWAKTGNGHHVGETVNIQTLHHDFRICGIVESGRGGRRMIPIETLGALTGSDGKASVIYIKSRRSGERGPIRQEIESTPGLQGYRVQSMDDIISMYTPSRFPGFDMCARRRHHDRCYRWLSGHIPVDVYGGSGAHPRDWHSQVHGSLEVDHCGSGVARVCGDGDCGRAGGHWGHFLRARAAGRAVSGIRI